jgi:hypothetical protein
MITHIVTMNMLQVVRNSCKRRGMTDDQVAELEVTITLKMVAWVIGILVLVAMVWVFTDPQFCFRREIINFVKSLDI